MMRCGALAVLLLPAIAVQARVHKSRRWAESQFAAAEHLQEALEAQPAADRTRRDYERVISAYRRVYLGAPISSKADPSVVASAQMTEEMGRRFSDSDVLRSAIQQYEYLRREYSGSKFRFEALFRIGEIYKDDLRDKPRGDAVFQEFLHRYPRNQFAEAARQALAEPAQPVRLTAKPAPRSGSKDSHKAQVAPDGDDDAQDSSTGEDTKSAAEEQTSRVIGIRHWSTPEYTRVAIDLEHGVKYESQRIDHPDRIFFDLFNTRLDSRLAGKTFDVSDGLLKAIRISQFKSSRTRVVLDLDESSDAKASLRSNPPRLIVDIRNKNVPANAATERQTVKPLPLKDVAETTDSTDAKPEDQVVADSAADKSEPAATVNAVAPRPASRTTVVLNNGVKKTIVDADDDDTPAKDTVAKLETPELDPPKPGVPEPTVPAMIPSPPSGNGRVRGSIKSRRKTQAEALDIHEAQPTSTGDRSLIRALGLKIGKIVIDPGHGGHDTGTIGPNGLEEKDLVLDVSRRLGKLLQGRLGADVIFTRKDDTFIPLETRTAIANQEAADLFVSVHANSSHDPDARGVETYYLNFTSSPDALDVAARENAVSEESIHELQDLVKKIALKEKIEESHEFASDVQRSLHTGLSAKNPGLRDRGVKKAPFIVLIGANMPSILAEISFVSNPADERKLQTADYRQKIAESLYRGIAKYVSGLSGVKVASKIEKDQGQ